MTGRYRIPLWKRAEKEKAKPGGDIAPAVCFVYAQHDQKYTHFCKELDRAKRAYQDAVNAIHEEAVASGLKVEDGLLVNNALEVTRKAFPDCKIPEDDALARKMMYSQ